MFLLKSIASLIYLHYICNVFVVKQEFKEMNTVQKIGKKDIVP